MNRALSACLSALLVIAAPVAQAADTVVIGTEADYAPFETIGPDGKPHGFDIEIGDAICASAKLTCTWRNMDFDGLIPALQAHRIDAAMSEISVTPAREKKVLFTDPITRTAAALISPAGSGISSDTLTTLKGKTVGVQSGTTEEAFAQAKLAGIATIQAYQSQLQAFQDLKAGRIDAVICDQGIGYDWLKQNAGAFVFSGAPLKDPQTFGTGTAIALRLGDDSLRNRLNKGIATILDNGTYARINAKYFPYSVRPGHD